MVTANTPVSFQIINLATNPPTTVGTYANVTAARAAAANLVHWELFATTTKQQGQGRNTASSPNLVYKKRMERHGDVRSGPTYGIDAPGTNPGQVGGSGFFGGTQKD